MADTSTHHSSPPTSSNPADTFARLVAAVIDTLLYLMASSAAILLLIQLDLIDGSLIDAWDTPLNGHWAVINVVGVVGFMLYDVLCTHYYGRTLGKKMLGMRVVGDLATRTKPTLGTAFKRFNIRELFPLSLLGAAVASVSQPTGLAIGAWTVVLIVTIVRHPHRQGLHDRSAGTYVVKI